jgi:hypothetical protein
MKHKHYDLIVAWADGANIECKDYDGQWYVSNSPMWHNSTEYRIKPEPQKELGQPKIQNFQLENQLQACRKLVDEQDEKICELSIKLAYANRSIEILNEEEEPQEPQFFYVYNNINTNNTWMSPTLMMERYGWIFIGKVRLEK